MSDLRAYFVLFLKGMAMGAADVVPGVSGGTIAFISGIYEELLCSIRACTPLALASLFSDGPRVFWRRINGTFLSVLFSGILFSVATLARLITYLLDHQPLLLWSFFFGLIVASILFIWRQLARKGFWEYLSLILGLCAALASAFAPHVQLEPTSFVVFGAGMLAICAMILPGISGSFILLLLGMYSVILGAISSANLSILTVFFLGCVAGLIVFSRLLSWLLSRFHGVTLSVLTGFLAGSLVMVWPWRESAIATNKGHSDALHLLAPSQYAQMVGDAQLLTALGLMIVGFVVVMLLEYIGARRASH
jgi:putative membrane protein